MMTAMSNVMHNVQFGKVIITNPELLKDRPEYDDFLRDTSQQEAFRRLDAQGMDIEITPRKSGRDLWLQGRFFDQKTGRQLQSWSGDYPHTSNAGITLGLKGSNYTLPVAMRYFIGMTEHFISKAGGVQDHPEFPAAMWQRYRDGVITLGERKQTSNDQSGQVAVLNSEVLRARVGKFGEYADFVRDAALADEFRMLAEQGLDIEILIHPSGKEMTLEARFYSQKGDEVLPEPLQVSLKNNTLPEAMRVIARDTRYLLSGSGGVLDASGRPTKLWQQHRGAIVLDLKA